MEIQCQDEISKSETMVLSIAGTQILRFDLICRICGNETDKNISIYGPDGLTNELALKINTYLPIKVSEEDTLPLNCCYTCTSAVLTWHELVVNSVDADRKLREIPVVVNNPVVENEENVENEPDAILPTQCYREEGKIELQSSLMQIFEEIKRDKFNIETHLRKVIEHNEIVEQEPVQYEVIEINIDSESKHVCEICDKDFSSKTGLQGHLKLHVQDYSCPVCCNSYNTKFKLDQHTTLHNLTDLDECIKNPNLIQCPYENCGEIFPSKLKLYLHKKTHSNDAEYHCEACGKNFRKKSFYNIHLEKHSETFQCKICDKYFANKKTLSEHLRLHTGETPYECNICKERFRCHSGLKYHEASHGVTRKFSCHRCTMSFARSSYLKVHLRKHSNDKPFCCKYCSQKFIQLGILNRHIRKLHRVCQICKEVIGNVRDLRSHMWKMHPNQRDLEL